MKKSSRRFLFAFLVASSCAAFTEYWYLVQSNADKIDKGSKKNPIARVSDTTSDIQRKPADRVIWQNVGKGEELFSGESIRTDESSEASIYFLKSQTTIDLEPDSLIVIEDESGQVALNFVQGNLFVKASENSSPDKALMVKSGESQIAVKNSELALGKKEQSEQLSLEVLAGSADVETGGRVLSLKTGRAGIVAGNQLQTVQTTLKVLSPRGGTEIYVNPLKRRTVLFSYEPISDDYQVILESGSSRGALTNQDKVSSNGRSGSLNAILKPGVLYWRLVATSSSGGPRLTSQIFRNRILPSSPPVLLAPQNRSNVRLTAESSEIIFNWSNPAQLSNLILEISSTATLNPRLVQKLVVGDTETFSLKPGIYFWRVSGSLKESRSPISSAVQTFTVISEQDVPQPQLVSPIANKRIPYSESQDAGIELNWGPIPNVTSYHLKLRSANRQSNGEAVNQTVRVLQPNYLVKKLRPGNYFWSVTADLGNRTSLPSEEWSFVIYDTPVIQWAEENKSYFYLTDKPTVSLAWSSGLDSARQWRLRWASEDENIENASWVYLNKTDTVQTLSTSGKHLFSVEAVGPDKTVLARAPARTIDVMPVPLLPPPEFPESQANPLEASSSGQAKVSWNPVKGATQYVLTLQEGSGPPRKIKTNKTTHNFSRMLPGKYSIRVQGIDQHSRLGSEGVEQIIRVPASSGIQAPSIKKLEVDNKSLIGKPGSSNIQAPSVKQLEVK